MLFYTLFKSNTSLLAQYTPAEREPATGAHSALLKEPEPATEPATVAL